MKSNEDPNVIGKEEVKLTDEQINVFARYEALAKDLEFVLMVEEISQKLSESLDKAKQNTIIEKTVEKVFDTVLDISIETIIDASILPEEKYTECFKRKCVSKLKGTFDGKYALLETSAEFEVYLNGEISAEDFLGL